MMARARDDEVPMPPKGGGARLLDSISPGVRYAP
jgi:hypothetical protein